jgi:putative peptidoglycan lipid II flippase
MLLLNRSFYALQSNWVPTAVALTAVAANAALDAVLYRLGIWGIPLATAGVNVIAATALLVLMRRRVGLERVGRTLGAVARVFAASAVAAGSGLGIWYALDAALGRSLAAQLASLGAAFVVAGAVYVGASRALAVRELETLLALRRRAP